MTRSAPGTGRLDLTPLLSATEARWPDAIEQVCRVCGCTDEECEDCIIRTGEPCFWIEGDLCSACAVGAGNRP